MYNNGEEIARAYHLKQHLIHHAFGCGMSRNHEQETATYHIKYLSAKLV